VRILVLSHLYPSPADPTAGTFVHEQAGALIELGHDVRVVSPKGFAPPLWKRWERYRDVPGVDRVDGVPVLYPRKVTLPGGRLGHWNAESMRFAIAGPLTRIHRRWPFDVIHAHMLVPDGWAAARVGGRMGVPVLATAHRADVLDVPDRGGSQRTQVEQAVAWVDQIVAVSHAMRRACEALATPQRPVAVVPNGADTRVFFPRDRAETRRRLGLPLDERIVAFVGVLTPRKGIDTLVDAMGALARDPAGAPLLTVAGIGELRGPLEARARELGITDRIRFVGKVPHDDVALWMAAGDVFCLPSLSEGLPTVVCEAMACGRAVVATAVDGTPEIVDDEATGLLVPPRDSEALAGALRRLLADEELRARFEAEALTRAAATYTWAANARAHSRLYEALTA
jgi:teichuronic acid biosynthesis glycosyltransferase TuaC